MGRLIQYLAKSPFALTILGVVLGVLIDQLISYVRDRVRFARELRDNSYIDVTGLWYAAWQTSIENEEKLNVEQVLMKQRGQTVRIHNLEKAAKSDGGYFWDGQMQFLQGRSLMGWYFARHDENNSSRGIMYFTYFSQKRVFYGKWVGASYDGELQTGMAVISDDRNRALQQLQQLLVRYPNRVGIVGYTVGSNTSL